MMIHSEHLNELESSEKSIKLNSAENNELYFELTLETASLISGGEGNATGYSFTYSSNHTTAYQEHYTQIVWADAQ